MRWNRIKYKDWGDYWVKSNYIYAYNSSKMHLSNFVRGTNIRKSIVPFEVIDLMKSVNSLKRLIFLKEEDIKIQRQVDEYIRSRNLEKNKG